MPTPDAMTPDRWTRLATLVPDALDLPPDRRAAFLDDACRLPTGEIDAELRADADALVRSAQDATDTDALQSPLAGLAGELAGEEGLAAHAPPETVGPWRVTGVLGEGGQAVVYRARRADGAFEREVALKLLRPGATGARMAARLAEERRVLARLEHPGIARLYDGGVADDGRPFLAMERIDGAPITDAAATLELRDQVMLLAEVADAVAYAHARLVVHRDLKPSNVLVADDGRPRLLDFGVAKLLEGASDPDLTVPGWMTPAYAAPEQVTGGDVTTATDVYALGVLGYEVLAGRRPYETAGLSPAETERVVCQTVPPVASSVAPRVPRDLDVILAKALAKEPERRYPTASALAEDLRRWQAGLPIEARSATASYRLGRFVRRHRAGVTAAAVGLAAVVAVSGVAFARVADERNRAQAEASKAGEAVEFMSEVLSAADGSWFSASEVAGQDATVADVLDAAAERLDAEPLADPLAEATVRRAVAASYRGLGRLADAETQLLRAVALVESRVEPPHPDLAHALHDLGAVRGFQGDLAAADSLLREAHCQWVATNPEPNRWTFAYTNDAALVPMGTGDYAEAARYLEDAVAIGRRVPDVPAHGMAVALSNLALVRAVQRELGEADALLRETVAVVENAQGLVRPELYSALIVASTTATRLGNPARADSLAQMAAQGIRETLGEDSDPYFNALQVRAQALEALGRLAEAESVADDLTQRAAARYGETYGTSVRGRELRGRIRTGLGRLDAGEADLRFVLTNTPEQGQMVGLSALAANLRRQGRGREAARLYESAAVLAEASAGSPSDTLASHIRRLAAEARGEADGG